MPFVTARFRFLSLTAACALGLLAGACTDYDVPGGDRPWPTLSDFPEHRPDVEETDKRRRRLYQQYGDLERAMPKPTLTPAQAPPGSLKVAVIQFPRGSFEIEPAGKEILSQVAAYAQQARAEIMLFGYSSQNVELAVGGSAREASQELATARLWSVGVALAENGVPVDRINLVARGNLDPAYLESGPAGEAGNRRVEIWFTR